MAKKFMPPDEVEEFALEFLREHHSENSIPVPIEEIIELRLKIDIVPTPGMVTETGVDATTSHDFTQINIDQRQYQSVPNRARFTLAHEVGHLVLHRSFVESRSVKFHDLRATFITQLLLKGVSLAQVMAVVGRTQIKTTNVYLRVLGCDLDGVTDKLGVTLPQDRLAQVIDLRG